MSRHDHAGIPCTGCCARHRQVQQAPLRSCESCRTLHTKRHRCDRQPSLAALATTRMPIASAHLRRRDGVGPFIARALRWALSDEARASPPAPESAEVSNSPGRPQACIAASLLPRRCGLRLRNSSNQFHRPSRMRERQALPVRYVNALASRVWQPAYIRDASAACRKLASIWCPSNAHRIGEKVSRTCRNLEAARYAQQSPTASRRKVCSP